MNDLTPLPSGELLLYTSSDGNVRLELNIQEDTIWMTQQPHPSPLPDEYPLIRPYCPDCFRL